MYRTWLMATLTEDCRKSPRSLVAASSADDISTGACLLARDLWEDATAESASFLLSNLSPSSPASATNEVSTSESKCAGDQKLVAGQIESISDVRSRVFEVISRGYFLAF